MEASTIILSKLPPSPPLSIDFSQSDQNGAESSFFPSLFRRASICALPSSSASTFDAARTLERTYQELLTENTRLKRDDEEVRANLDANREFLDDCTRKLQRRTEEVEVLQKRVGELEAELRNVKKIQTDMNLETVDYLGFSNDEDAMFVSIQGDESSPMVPCDMNDCDKVVTENSQEHQASLVSIIKDRDRTIEALQHQLQTSVAAVSKAEERLAEAQIENEELQDEAAFNESHMNNLTAELQSRDIQLASVQQDLLRIQEIEQSNVLLAKSLLASNEAHVETDAQCDRYEILINDILASQDDLSRLRRMSTRQVWTLESWMRELEDRDARIFALEAELLRATKHNARIKGAYDAKTEELEGEIERLTLDLMDAEARAAMKIENTREIPGVIMREAAELEAEHTGVVL